MNNKKKDKTQDNGGDDGGLQTKSEASLSITPPDDSQDSESTDTQDNG